MVAFKNIISLFLILLVIFSYGQNPGLTFGGTKNEAGFSLSVTADDGYILAGSTRSYGAGSWDGYAVKLNKNGTLQWSNTYGWQHYDHFQSVIELNNGYLFVGYNWDYGPGREDIYLLKTDLSGNRIFDKLYGTHLRDVGFSVAKSLGGGFIVLGYSRGVELHGDIFLFKTDNEGNEIWRNSYGTVFDDYAYSIVENTDGSVLIFGSTGSFYDDVHYNFKAPSADWILIRVDKNGDELWRKTFSADGHDFANEIKPASDGGYYLFGSSMSYGSGSFDMLLMKVDEDWNEVWKKTFGGEDYEYGMSMDINQDGDLYLFGSTKSFGQNNTPDYYLIKTTPDGEELWTLTIGGNDLDYGHQVAVTADKGCAVIGKTRSFGAGEYDMMLAKINKKGMIEQLIDNIDTSNQEQLVIYPNPTNGNVKLKTWDLQSSYQLDLVSLNGFIVKRFTLQPPEYRFNVENISAGAYIYRITKQSDKNFIVRGKLIVR